MRWNKIALAFFLLFAPLKARADYQFIDGNGAIQTTKSQTCGGIVCLQHVLGDAAGVVYSLANPFPVALDFAGTLFAIGQQTIANSISIVPAGDIRSTGNITIQDTGSSSASGQNGTSIVTGSPTASSTVASAALNGVSLARFQLAGTWTGTVGLEQSIDSGTTWGALICQVNGTGSTSGFVGLLNQFTANGIADCPIAGATTVRARGVAAMTGTVNVTLVVSNSSGIVKSASIQQTLEVPNTSSGVGGVPTSCRLTSAAGSTNATNCKNSAGRAYSVSACNVSGATRYVKVYDKASAPTVGTDIPKQTIAINAGQCVVKDWSNLGFYFPTGIAFATTVGNADGDTAAVTAGDLVGIEIDYN